MNKIYLGVLSFFVLIVVSCDSPFQTYESPSPQSNTSSGVRENSAETIYRCDLVSEVHRICVQKTWLRTSQERSEGGSQLELLFWNPETLGPEKVSDAKLSFWSQMLHGNDFEDEVILELPLHSDNKVVFNNIFLSCTGADWILTVRFKQEPSQDWDRVSFTWKQDEFL